MAGIARAHLDPSERLDLLAEIFGAIGEAFGSAEKFERVAKLLVPRFADVCLVERMGEEGLEISALEDVDSARAAAFREIRRRYSRARNQAVARLIESGKTVFLQKVDPSALLAAAENDDHGRALATMFPESAIITPLAARDRVIGSVLLGRYGDEFREEDVPLVEMVARRLALGMDNARLFAAEAASRRAAERDRDLLAWLQRVTSALGAASRTPDVLDVVLGDGVGAIGAVQSAVYRLVGTPPALVRIGGRGVDEGLASEFKAMQLTEDLPSARAVRERRTVVVDADGRDSDFLPLVHRAGIDTFFSAPLVAGGGTIGAISVGFPKGHVIDDVERGFLEAFASQATVALSRAILRDELAASEARYRGIVEATLEGVWTMDARRRTTFVNRRVCELVGYSPEEMLGRDVVEFMAPGEGRERVADEQFSERRGGVAGEYEMKLLHRSGRHVWVHISAAPKLDEAGAFAGSVSLLTDITARKREEERQRFLLDASRNLSGTIEVEATLREIVRSAVPRFADLASLDLLEEDGTPRNLEITHLDPAIVERARDIRRRWTLRRYRDPAFGEFLRNGQPRFERDVTPEYIAGLAQSEEHRESLLALQLRSMMTVPLFARGRSLGVLMLAFCESDRRYDDADLRVVEELARRAAMAVDNARLFAAEQKAREDAEAAARRTARLQAATAALVAADSPQAIASGALGAVLPETGAARGGLASFGTSGEMEVIAAVGFDAEDRLLTQAKKIGVRPDLPLMQSVLRGDPICVSSRQEAEHWLPGFTPLSDAFVVVPLVVARRTIGALWVAWPTAHKASVAELEFLFAIARLCAQASDRARLHREAIESNARKDEFLAMLAHELRNPLAPALTALELIRRKSEAGLPASRERDTAERQIRSLARLVDDLLDVARINRGKVQIRPEATDVTQRLSVAVEVARPVIDAREHRLTVSAEGGLFVSGDPQRLEQVFANLLNNAAKYTPPHGEISVSAAREGEEIVVRVRDNGPGIPPEMRDQVFDLFVQGRRSLDRSGGGLGIGLTVVKQLIQLHHGSVSVDSGPDRGSEFTVRLPAFRAEVTPAAEANADVTPTVNRAMRVLVVDDNRDAADTLCDALGSSGFETRAAYDGLEALKAAAEFHPRVVVLDIGLPGIDGYEVAKRMRADLSLAPLMLVALSGYGQESDREKSRDAGFDVHLLKPTDLRSIERLLGSIGDVQTH